MIGLFIHLPKFCFVRENCSNPSVTASLEKDWSDKTGQQLHVYKMVNVDLTYLPISLLEMRKPQM